MNPNFLRLIYTYHNFGKSLDDVRSLARDAGYTMCAFNGIVHSVIHGNELFQLSDILLNY